MVFRQQKILKLHCLKRHKIVSSNINEVTRSVLNVFIFFYDKISQVQKRTKRMQGTKKHQKALRSIQTQPI